MTIKEILALTKGVHNAKIGRKNVKINVLDSVTITIDETETIGINDYVHIDLRSEGKYINVWTIIAGMHLFGKFKAKDLTLNQ
jgi:hypothetical protein